MNVGVLSGWGILLNITLSVTVLLSFALVIVAMVALLAAVAARWREGQGEAIPLEEL